MPSQNDSELSAVVIEHLADIAAGRCTITDQEIVEAAQTDPLLAEILTGLLFLHEDLEFRAAQRDRALAEAETANREIEAFSHELEAANDELERRLKEQTRLNEALSAFTGRVAHDLRTPLASVAMAAQLIAADQDALGEQTPQELDVIERQSARMLTLVDRLLDLARASGTVTPEPIDPRALVSEAASDIEGLEVRVADLPPRIVADPTSLNQAARNLFQNAVSYASVAGKATVDVTCRQVPKGWELAVADRGPGIDVEDAEALFKPFRRGSAARGHRGSGLGLSIVAAAAEAHGGRAYHLVRPGGGSVFCILIPNLAGPEPDLDVEAADSGGPP